MRSFDLGARYFAHRCVVGFPVLAALDSVQSPDACSLHLGVEAEEYSCASVPALLKEKMI